MREPGEPAIAGKLTVRAGGRKLVLRKHPWESSRHVLLKALVFALYVPDYPGLVVEPPATGRYKPDLLATDLDGSPVFWAECGETGRDKLGWLLKHQAAAHLVLAKQAVSLDPWLALVGGLAAEARRSAPVDLVLVPRDADRFVDPGGEITVRREDVRIERVGA
jgi:hypothetical protein